MGFSTQYTLAIDDNFRRRVEQAIVTAAIAITAEDNNALNHINRVRLARSVLLEPARYADLMARGVASNPVISLASSDSDIQFTVNTNWNAYAGDDVL